MGGKRFGAGVLGGLLLGFMVIGSTGLPALGAFGPILGANASPSGLKDAGPVATTTASLTEASSSTNGSAAAIPSPPMAYTTTTTSASTSQNEASANFGAASAAKRVSNLDSIPSQTPLLNGLVLLPLLVAFLLGAILYRASKKSAPEVASK